MNLHCPINKLGYGTVGRNLLPELKKLGVNVALFPIGNIEVDNAEEKEAVMWALKNAETFNYNAPSVKIWHQHDMATRIGGGRHYGMPIFELDTFTPLEKHHLNSVHVLNCSKWAQGVCESNGVHTSAGIVPLGYNPNVFFPTPYPKTDKFRVFNMGKWEVRKGHDILPYIFASAFNPNDNVELVMLNHNPFYTAEENESWRDYYRQILFNHNVTFLDRVGTSNEVADIIRSSHCGFFPTRAEGWNLEALETLACGRKLVTTKYSGHTEFTGQHYDKYELEVAVDGKWFTGQGKWLNIDEEKQNEMVLDLRAAYQEFMDGKLVEGRNQAENFTWHDSAKTLCEVIELW